MPKILFKTHFTSKLQKGFTILELLVSIAIVGILISVAAPKLSEFTVKLRVDNEVSELQRLVLSARNTAINTGRYVTLCPLNGSVCGTNWANELSVFANNDSTLVNNQNYDSANEELIKVKGEVTTGDSLTFSDTIIRFAPTGRVLSGGNGKISYCPQGDLSFSRGLEISLSGRVYATSDLDDDGKDEYRNASATEVSCS